VRDLKSLKQDAIEVNLAVVEAHFHSEAVNEVDKALALFTEDVVWESPTRGLLLRGKKAAGDNYKRMFKSFRVEGFRCLQRFATEDRVVDDSVLTATLVGNGVENAPVPIGTKVEIRLLHVFEMRRGKISKELVFENWKVLQPALNHLPESSSAASLCSRQWS
jgi:ketosteroid isomerase-like protein